VSSVTRWVRWQAFARSPERDAAADPRTAHRDTNRLVAFSDAVLLMVVAFLPFATSVLAGALRSGHGQRTAVVFYAIAFDLTALTFNAVWQYARHHRLLSEALEAAGATAISRRFSSP
jgi:uncharacterized membrane protein